MRKRDLLVLSSKLSPHNPTSKTFSAMISTGTLLIKSLHQHGMALNQTMVTQTDKSFLEGPFPLYFILDDQIRFAS
jgi:hypothetical protein